MKKIFLLIAIAFVAMSGALSEANAQEFQKPEPGKWYRLITRYNGSDIRRNRCIQYFPPGSEHDGMLWSADTVAAGTEAYDYQMWRFEPSADDPDLYAMVCRGDTTGYVNACPTQFSPSGRWVYAWSDADTVPANKYEFKFVTSATLSGVDTDTGFSYSAIATVDTEDTTYDLMNAGGPQQDYAINVWYETYSEDANEWLFMLSPEANKPSAITIVESDSDEAAKEVYDIYGRQITNPAPGHIYIVGGRKVLLVE